MIKYLEIPYSTIQNNLKKANSHVPEQDNKTTADTTIKLHTTIFSFSIVYRKHGIQFQYHTSDSFSDNCVFHVSELVSTHNTHIRETESSKEIQRHE